MALPQIGKFRKGSKLLLIFKDGTQKVIKYMKEEKQGGKYVVVDSDGNSYRVKGCKTITVYKPLVGN